MPPLEQAERNMPLVVFPFIGRDRGGHIRTGAGVEVQGRWVDVRQETPSVESSEIGYDVIAVLPSIYPISSLVFNGSLSDYQDGTGTASSDLAIIKRVDNIVDIKGRDVRYSAKCDRYTQKANV